MGNDADQMVLLVISIILLVTGVVAIFWFAVSQIKKKTSKRQNVVSLVVGIALVLCGASLAITFFNKDKLTPLESSLIKQAEERNKSLPTMLDENTRFEEVTVFGTEIYYRNTVVNNSADQVDKDLFQNIMYQKLTQHLCPQKDIIAMLNGGVKYRYNYFGNKGTLISTVVISKETCGIR